MLIFDEVITGFRHAIGGYQSICGVTPDLTTMGKAIANGFPIAALGGRADLMDHFNTNPGGDVFFAGTYNGHAGSVAAALATIEEMEQKPVHQHINALGDRMRDGLQEILNRLDLVWTVAGFGSVYTLYFMDGPVENYTDLLRNDAAQICRLPPATDRSGHLRDADEPQAQPHQLLSYRSRYRPHARSRRHRPARDVPGLRGFSMIVDVHTHTPRYRTAEEAGADKGNAMWRPDQVQPSRPDWNLYLEAMKPVDKAIVFNIAADPRNPKPDDGGLQYPTPQVNDDTAAFVQANPEKLIGFLTIHPLDPHALEEIERGTQDLGLRGIKLGAELPEFRSARARKRSTVYKRAEELGLPILFHQGTSPVRNRRSRFRPSPAYGPGRHRVSRT